MRTVHAADSHLCDRIGRLDRTENLRARVERIAVRCEEHRADALVIAGTLFSERAAGDEIADALAHVHRTVQPFFARGGTVLAVTGNHDNNAQIDLGQAGSFLASPRPSGGVFARDRMYLQNGLSFGSLEAAAGDRVQFVLVPYPRAARYELPDTYRNREEEHRPLTARIGEWLADVLRRPVFDAHRATAPVAHVHVRGANVHRSLFRMSDADGVPVDPATLASGWADVALGDIHAPQPVGGAKTVPDPGPLDRLDCGEMADDRGVLQVDVGPAGAAAPSRWLSLDPMPTRPWPTRTPNCRPSRRGTRTGNPRSRVEVRDGPGTTLSGDEFARRSRAVFPWLHQPTWAGDATVAAGEDAAAPAAAHGRPFAERSATTCGTP